MKLTQDFNLSNIKTLDDLIRFVSIFRDNVFSVVNGGLELDVNLDTNKVSFNFLVANKEYGIPHNLGKVPNGYILTKSNAATSLYSGTTANTDTVIYLKSSSIANVEIEVF